jgi:hypothetical protein
MIRYRLITVLAELMKQVFYGKNAWNLYAVYHSMTRMGKKNPLEESKGTFIWMG